MGIFIHKSIKSLGSTHNKIVMLGLKQTGKSSILKQLKLNSYSQESQQIGYKIIGVNYEKLTLNIVSLLVEKYYPPIFNDLNALIYVIDSDSEYSIEQAINTIDKVLSYSNYAMPLLIFVNKQDQNLIKAADIKEKLQFQNNYLISDLLIQECCALNGKGIYEAFDWLDQACKKQENVIQQMIDAKPQQK